jgi:predicted RecB family endonuclease
VLVSTGWEAASREDLLALIGLLQRQEQAHEEQVAELRVANKALIEANAVLARRVAELEKKVNRNSGTSNMPPSTDVFGLPRDDQSAEGGPSGAARGGAVKPRLWGSLIGIWC